MKLHFQIVDFVEKKVSKGLLLFSKLQNIKLIYKINLMDLDHVENNNIWISCYVLILLLSLKPYLQIKIYKKTYLKHNFVISTIFMSKKIKGLMHFYNLILACKSNINFHFKIYKNLYYFKFLSIFFIKNFEIRPEFFRWNDFIYGHMHLHFYKQKALALVFKNYFKI